MEVRTFRAASLKAALELIRAELGPEATVLQTREVAPGLLTWLTGGNRIEVVAATGRGRSAEARPAEHRQAAAQTLSKGRKQPQPRATSPPPHGSEGKRVRDEEPDAPTPVPSPSRTRVRHHDSKSRAHSRQAHAGGRAGSHKTLSKPSEGVTEDKQPGDRIAVPLSKPLAMPDSAPSQAHAPSAVRHLSTGRAIPALDGQGGTVVLPTAPLPTALFSIFTALLEGGFPPDIAGELCQRLKTVHTQDWLTDRQLVVKQLQTLIASDLPCAPTLRRPLVQQPHVIGFVGPSQVGKSTALWHLAAAFERTQNQSVGILSLGPAQALHQPHRAAHDAWLRCATSLRVTAEQATHPAEAQAALGRMAHLGLVLVEFSGDSAQPPMGELAADPWRAALRMDEVHLVLDASQGPLTWQSMLDRYRPWQPTSLWVSKIDEARHRGSLYALLRNSHLPLSYLTAGICVPADLHEADATRLAGWILGQEFAT